MTLSTKLQLALSFLTKPIYGGLGHILMFHRVTPHLPLRVPGQARLEITPARLEEIVQFFRRQSYDFIALDELHTRLNPQDIASHKKNKFVSFTFDDGYLDNLQYAYPVLKGMDVPFTIYVAASFPERQAVLWWYMLDDLILTHDELSFELPDGPLSLDCGTVEQKMLASQRLRALLKYAPMHRFEELVSAIFSPYHIDLNAKTEELALSWQQIIDLSHDPLVTIGSHSLHHFPLKNLDDAAAWEEIIQSKAILEEKLGCPVENFAYPYGEKNEAGQRDFELVRKAGYKTAVTTRSASIFPAHAHHLETLPRFDAPALPGDSLKLAVNGLLSLKRNRFRRLVTD